MIRQFFGMVAGVVFVIWGLIAIWTLTLIYAQISLTALLVWFTLVTSGKSNRPQRPGGER